MKGEGRNRRNRHNYYDDCVAVAGVDFHLDRISFDAIDGRRTDLGQHGESYGAGGAKGQSGIGRFFNNRAAEGRARGQKRRHD